MNPPDNPRDDRELIDAIRRGDESAFDILYYRHRDWVISLATRFTGNTDDALDVAQETFIYLARKIPSLALTARMTTFLYPVVKHLSLATRRKRSRSEEITLDPAAPSRADPAMQREDLAAALAKLPEAHRETILLRFVDGFDLTEIAAAMNVPLGTVKSRLHQAIEKLRDDPRTREFFLE